MASHRQVVSSFIRLFTLALCVAALCGQPWRAMAQGYLGGPAGGPGAGAGGPGAYPGAYPGAPGTQGLPGAPGQEVAPQTGVRISAIENLNALFIQYESAAQLQEVTNWIKTLDVPTLQVSMEAKFVEVIEDRAKELSSEFTITDLTDLSVGNNNIATGSFGTDQSEFTSPFEPGVEGLRGANLPKGTSVINLITGSSPISLQLRALEAQGVVNIVSGPHITVLNGETGDFEIERRFGIPVPVGGTSGTGGTSSGNSTQLTTVPSLSAVQLTLEPQVTRLGNITIDVDGTIEDIDSNLGAVSLLQPSATDTIVAGQPNALQGVYNSNFDVGVLRKVVTTKVRIKDGGTVVLGGWTSQRDQQMESGVPILRDLPFVGKIFFSRNKSSSSKITLLIFVTGKIVD